MEHVAPILQSISSLVWAAFAFTALFVLKPEIVRLLGRLKKGKLLGQEIELNDDLMKLETSVAAVEKEAVELTPVSEQKEDSEQEGKFDATLASIFQQAATAPKIALMTLSAELEKKARHALATRGLLRGRSAVPLKQALLELHQFGFPPNLSSSMQSFADVRNKIIHGLSATDDDAVRTLDLGITILRALDALPIEINIIFHPGIDIYFDAQCISLIPDAKGVILETTSPGGLTKTLRIFPTMRTDYQVGKQVAWEWNMLKVWPAAWYRDPRTDVITQAWGSSAEFVGRPLDEV